MHREDGRDGARQRAQDDTRTSRQLKRNKCTKITIFHWIFMMVITKLELMSIIKVFADWNLSVDHCINLWWSCNPVYSKYSSLSARHPAPFFLRDINHRESKTKSIRSNYFCLSNFCQTFLFTSWLSRHTEDVRHAQSMIWVTGHW